jgi:hypothetical protein
MAKKRSTTRKLRLESPREGSAARKPNNHYGRV